MKAKSLLIGTVLALCGTGANAQWVVTDPGNLAQSIINMSDNIAHTSKTAVNTADSFAETVKIYEQAKKKGVFSLDAPGPLLLYSLISSVGR